MKRIGKSPAGKPITLDASKKTRPWRNLLTEEMMAKGQKYLRSQGCTDEGIAAVEKFMADRGLIDYEAGFALCVVL